MKHIKALLIKFVMITLVLFIVLGLGYEVSFADILALSTILTVAAYLIGDLFILPRYGNTAATIADFGLVYLGLWALGDAFIEGDIPLGLATFYATAGITIGEWFFHRYMDNEILPNQNAAHQNPAPRESFATEFAEESDVSDSMAKETSKDDNR
ncbi:YndM family protein [Pseudalkalibacillus decolorationis]|uniref:YndM family protein n=1 Tax=Pseudalkalibacillus decolorationis TaxID=163879 RepID=UPI002147C36B|nr:YndM family protein [Pseudalkalibacillus decolorationis]